jgi:rubrerythrin
MTREELFVIRQAVLSETEGYDFYMMAAAKTPDQEAKQAFEQLAMEEQKHIDWLKDLYEKISKDNVGAFDANSLEDPPPPRLFKWSNAARESGTLAVSVFGIGIQMEKAAIDFYTKAAENTAIPQAKALYEKLVKWEYEHMRQFEKDYDELKEDWWEKQGFSPA